MPSEMSTREKILYYGKKEFLAKGFADASLRNIASSASLTTGAIYAHFADKDELFKATTNTAYHKILGLMDEMAKKFIDKGGNALDYEPAHGIKEFENLYDLLYADFDAFYILITGANGSSREGFVHKIVEIEAEYTYLYLEQLKKRYNSDISISHEAVHILSDSYVNALMEPIRHKMDKKSALESVALLGMFHIGGWQSVLETITKG